jgi:bifunctional non-homologous end joining protein LigD
MLPHISGRPLVLERFRKDIAAGGFIQQGRPDHFPDYVPRIDVVRADGKQGHHTGCDSAAALVYLANQGTLTFHGWSSRLPDLEHPDRLVIDLDPAEDDFEPVRHAALLLKEVLAEYELGGWPMTTGSRGVHVIVELSELDWEETWELAKRVRADLVARDKKAITGAFYKSQRRGRLYVDIARARRGQLAIMPWTVRARPGAPVATPLSWDEVADPQTNARRWTIKDVLAREA